MYRQFDNTVHQWNNGSIWDTGVAPVAGDDVDILMCITNILIYIHAYVIFLYIVY